ncbi:DeoR family transcriptional regulator [Bacillus amyloliquefaciens]|uniref:Transcriptional regulator (DeoR family) n=1 Tax=Bacillus amyloliquefaciens (strain ATCC 23350 / DSM 7 / BCRC 11601 / CCUG 28519 / NBRC 15535 / NRRL B-14393 / F) TaxID=692420 RepID=A0A9P1JEC0_BACAS|nr:HTH-type transcriptional repressor YcnK [Bacillus amyloliquefaciens]AZV91780.1 DeoR family transcriptional regulator [Bacillus amyloliquefaciens]OBR28030.1 HTH-type transcriptional repressor YcnK [Bacillus amyloliquefaciens]CBI41490.1 putative transcriptional regulator (DeoR family) [Bacillus amyloliquefaciens DSM 7] [Bacillus amyloliquefaciens DSM 7 = ATCC 23350]
MHKKEDAELLPIHRQQTLLEWLKEEGPLKISDISERFGVSEMTVYRDVNQLADANRIIRTPGGITLPPASEQSANQCGYCLRPIQHSYSVQLITVSQAVEQMCCIHCAILRYEDKKEEVSHVICKDFLLQTTLTAASAYFLVHADIDLHCCRPQAIPFSTLDYAERFQKGFGGVICTFDKAADIILHDRQKGCTCSKT